MKYKIASATLIKLFLAMLIAIGSGQAMAGPYSDDLGKCLVKSTTSADKNLLVKWLFATAAMHPEVEPIAAVTDQQRKELTQNMANLFQKLLTESCRAEAQSAFKFEGAETIATSFRLLGQVAARELFTSPAVAKGMASIGDYIDKGQMQALFKADK